MSDAELVAHLLGCDEPQPEQTADRLLNRNGLRDLIPLRELDLQRLGASAAGASNLEAAFELARRLAAAPLRQLPIILSSRQRIAHYLALHHSPKGQEVMGALYLDIRHQLIADREIFRGGLSRTTVEPMPLLKEAILLDASGAILYHNHPSGDPLPSPEDYAWTDRIRDAFQLVGITLLDHLIVTYQGRWTSACNTVRW